MSEPGRRPAPELSIGEVAARAGMSVSALHFYEAKGLIRSRRSDGNQRRFPRGVLRRLAVIKIAQRAGLALTDIKAALATLPQDRPPSRADWKRLAAGWRAELDERIRRLSQLRDQLDTCIGWGAYPSRIARFETLPTGSGRSDPGHVCSTKHSPLAPEADLGSDPGRRPSRA
jgi:MerR family redox-sensitive transcriptional activator SoxR